MKKLGNNIRKLRNSKGLTQQQLADIVGATTYTTITKWESGSNSPQGKDLVLLSEYFNVSVDELLGLKGMLTTSSEYYYLPTAISAGLPLNVDAITNDEVEKISIADEVMGKWAGHKDIFITKIYGDSMNNIIPDGSLIAIKPMLLERLKNGDIVVYSAGYDYSVKHYYKYGETLVFKPNSTNHEHKEQIYDANNDIKIYGKVVTYIVNVD